LLFISNKLVFLRDILRRSSTNVLETPRDTALALTEKLLYYYFLVPPPPPLLLLHPFNAWVSRHQKGKPFWILLGGSGTSLQTDNHAMPHHSVSTGRMPFLPPSQHYQSTEVIHNINEKQKGYKVDSDTICTVLLKAGAACCTAVLRVN